MKKFLASLGFVAVVGLIALPCAAAAHAGAQATDFVTRSGDQLLLDGGAYRFTGFNIYNANSDGDCGPAMSSGSTLDDSLSAMGASSNAFRAWFFQSLATTGGKRDWSAFDHTLAVARSHGVKVIATLTNQFADCEAPGGYKDESWYTAGYRAPDPAGTVSYRDWVAEIVRRYKDDPTILAWQLVNEAEVRPSPDAADCSANAEQILRSFATDVSGLVKSIDPNHLVSLGTLGSGQCGAREAEYQDLHDVPTIDFCEYHDYEPNAAMPGDEFNGLALRIDQCHALHKPIFVGESGIVPNDVGGTLAARAEAFDAKFDAQFSAGVAGELVWNWSPSGSRLDDYDVGAGDPTIGVLARHALGPPRRDGGARCRRGRIKDRWELRQLKCRASHGHHQRNREEGKRRAKRGVGRHEARHR